MNGNEGHEHPRSTAQIAGHPIHPMLIPFPIVCFILTFVCDVLYVRGRTDLSHASNWLLAIGVVFAALAAIAGLTDFFGDKRIQGSDAIYEAGRVSGPIGAESALRWTPPWAPIQRKAAKVERRLHFRDGDRVQLAANLPLGSCSAGP